MKTFVLTYDGFVQFEVVLTCLFMKRKGEIVTVSLDGEQVVSFEGFKIQPHKSLKEIDVEEVDLFVIPGGNAKTIYNNSQLNEILSNLNEKKKIIAAICAGPVHLGKAGILNGKKFVTEDFNDFKGDFEGGTFVNQNVVIDDNIITAKPNGYVDFAIEIGKVMKIYNDENDLNGTIEFFKFFNNGES